MKLKNLLGLLLLPLSLAVADCDGDDDGNGGATNTPTNSSSGGSTALGGGGANSTGGSNAGGSSAGGNNTGGNTGGSSVGGNSAGGSGGASPGGVAYAFMAVHLDPGSFPKQGGDPAVDRPQTCWPTLVELIAAADTGGHKLTLMFTAQWGYYLDQPPCPVPDDGDFDGTYEYQGAEYGTCKTLVHAFEAHGHAIAFHHHPFDAPASWDGFTNDPSKTTHPDYLGTVAQAKAYVDPLSATGAAGVVSATTEEFPLGGGFIRFTSARGPTPYVDATDRGDLASRPCGWGEDGHPVWRLRMRSYTSSGVYSLVRDTELPQAVQDLSGTGGEPWTVGLVTHAINVYDNTMVPYEALFTKLQTLGLTLEKLETVEGYYAWTSGDPASPLPANECPPDEGLDPPT